MVSSSIFAILLTRRSWRLVPPNPESSHAKINFFALSGVCFHPDKHNTFELLCSRVLIVSETVVGVTARTLRYLLATMHTPSEDPQNSNPLSCCSQVPLWFPLLTAFPTLEPKSG